MVNMNRINNKLQQCVKITLCRSLEKLSVLIFEALVSHDNADVETNHCCQLVSRSLQIVGGLLVQEGNESLLDKNKMDKIFVIHN